MVERVVSKFGLDTARQLDETATKMVSQANTLVSENVDKFSNVILKNILIGCVSGLAIFLTGKYIVGFSRNNGLRGYFLRKRTEERRRRIMKEIQIQIPKPYFSDWTERYNENQLVAQHSFKLLVGESGIGKTTLASKYFNEQIEAKRLGIFIDLAEIDHDKMNSMTHLLRAYEFENLQDFILYFTEQQVKQKSEISIPMIFIDNIHLLRQGDDIKSDILHKLIVLYSKIECEILLISSHSDIGTVIRQNITSTRERLIVLEMKHRSKQSYINFLISKEFEKDLVKNKSEVFDEQKANSFLDEIGLNFEMLERYRRTKGITISGIIFIFLNFSISQMNYVITNKLKLT